MTIFDTLTGVDFSNRPIIVLIGSRVPAKKISLDMFILYTLSTMDPIVEKEYSIVYVHSGMTSENKLSFSWLRKVYSMFTRKYVPVLESNFNSCKCSWEQIQISRSWNNMTTNR
jgi:hypothetical protein